MSNKQNTFSENCKFDHHFADDVSAGYWYSKNKEIAYPDEKCVGVWAEFVLRHYDTKQIVRLTYIEINDPKVALRLGFQLIYASLNVMFNYQNIKKRLKKQ